MNGVDTGIVANAKTDFDPSSSKVLLGCSGGGARGVMAARALGWLQERMDYRLHELIDLGGGTSTGSLVVAALAVGMAPKKVEQIYCSKAAGIFTRTVEEKLENPAGVWDALYAKEPLTELLQELIGERAYTDTTFPLLVSTFVTNGVGAKVYNHYDPVLPEDGKLHTALLASASAPTYFNDTQDGTQACIDGGMWANLPTQILSAYAEGQHLGWDPRQLLVIDLGCGHTPLDYTTKHSGLVEVAPHIVDTLLEGQRSGAELLCRQRFGDRFTYCEPVLKPGQDVLNNGSPKFLKEMLAVMDTWLEEHKPEMTLLLGRLNAIGKARGLTPISQLEPGVLL